MIKKILGAVFIVIAGLLSLSVVAQIPSLIKAFNAIKGSESIGYAIGNVVGLLLMIAIIAVLLRFGIKWVKKQQAVPEKEEAGKIEW